MSRFDYNDEGIPWAVWEQIVSRALICRPGQQMLADLEAALLALPERKLIAGKFMEAGQVCAVGAYVAKKHADRLHVTIEALLNDEDNDMPSAETEWETVEAGESEGMSQTVAWHMAWLNDEQYGSLTDEERYNSVLAFVQRALGRESVAA